MIYLGLKDEDKIKKITEYTKKNNIQHIIVFPVRLEVKPLIVKSKSLQQTSIWILRQLRMH